MTVLCVGEALVVLTPAAGRLADGGPLMMTVGGAEANVAIHLARLGRAAAFTGAVGDDALGELVRTTLAKELVDTSQVVTDRTRPTGFYFKDPTPAQTDVLYHRAGSAASAYDCAALTDLTHATGLHVTGVAAAVWGPDAVVRLLDRARAASVRTSVDVNLRPTLWANRDAAKGGLLAMCRAADVVLTGLDEAHELWETSTPQAVRALLPEVELVVKDGPGSVVVFTAGEVASVPATADVTVVELVGAGDAFAAAYLHARLLGAAPEAAASAGHQLAAHVIGTSADNGERGAEIYTRLGCR